MLKINEMYGVGKTKYMVNYYTGKKHEDGSDFYDTAFFKNKEVKRKFIKKLEALNKGTAVEA